MGRYCVVTSFSNVVIKHEAQRRSRVLGRRTAGRTRLQDEHNGGIAFVAAEDLRIRMYKMCNVGWRGSI